MTFQTIKYIRINRLKTEKMKVIDKTALHGLVSSKHLR